jgi:hypothetical protein
VKAAAETAMSACVAKKRKRAKDDDNDDMESEAAAEAIALPPAKKVKKRKRENDDVDKGVKEDATIDRSMYRHIRSTPTGEKLYICADLSCGKAFAQVDKLRKHVIKLHMKKRKKKEYSMHYGWQ